MSTDTRHPQYDDATLLAVMDDACQETHTKHPEVGGTILLASDFNTVAWPAEKPARLALARGLLARLPEPTPPTADGKTPGQVAFEAWGNQSDEWHKSLCSNWQAAASAVLAAFGGAEILRWKDAAQSIREEINKQQDRAEKAEAELARKNEMWENQMIVIRRLQLQVEELEDKSYLSTLRPIAEAGEVPDGAVRYYFIQHPGFFGTGAQRPSPKDTHYADIYLPEASQPAVEAEKAEKPEPSIREVLDAIPVYPPAQPWQPAVGEPVRLVSGGPEMTVTHTDSDNIIVAWFDLSEVNTMNFPAACLVSAKEAQP